MTELSPNLTWPAERAGEALFALAQAAGLEPRESADAHIENTELALSERLELSARQADVELTSTGVSYPETGKLIASVAPALLRLESEGAELRLALLLSGGARPMLLLPDGTRRRVDAELLRSAWCGGFERRVEPLIDGLLGPLELGRKQAARARRALADEYLGAVEIGGAFALGVPVSRPERLRIQRAGLFGLAATFALCSTLAGVLSVAAWIPLGRVVLGDRWEPAWLLAWGLMLASVIPLRWLAGALQARIVVRVGQLMRSRLLVGATRLAPERVLGEGSGALLGRVLDSEKLEALLLASGFVLFGAAIDLALTFWVLGHGPAAVQSRIGFALIAVIGAILFFRQRSNTSREFATRRAATNDLVERMAGQRTRLIQEAPEHWHRKEDALLERYIESGRVADRTTLWLTVGVHMGWLLWGLGALWPAFVQGGAQPTAFAIGLGGVLLGQRTLRGLGLGLGQLASCQVAWLQTRPIHAAATDLPEPGLISSLLQPATAGAPGATGMATLRARAVGLRHAGRDRDALSSVEFELQPGERVVLEGPSGSGKSSLVSLLGGWRQPTEGSLRLDDLDRRSLGAERWRERVAVAPQFHENFVFSGTLAFNALLCARAQETSGSDPVEEALGSAPPAALAEQRAAEVLTELGLDEVMARMPGGLSQLVGETGWQLSHGERSRLFLARVLLADADVIVLDESLAALDPVTADRVLQCLERRRSSCLLVAHP